MTALFSHEDITNAFGNSVRIPDPAEGLNPDQRKVVTTTEGPLRIMAGAGSGKTTVLTRRIAHILNQKLALPGQILAVTFTKKAAGEMRARLASMLGSAGRGVVVGNFHAISSEILRRHTSMLGLSQNFTILDEDGQREVIASIALARGFIRSKKDKSAVMAFSSQIASWKGEGFDADQITDHPDLASISPNPPDPRPEFLDYCAQVFSEYQAELAQRRWCDFADLILHTVRLFRAHPDILKAEAARFRYILVDEFQDTDKAQMELIYLLAAVHRNLCVVGDTDQSIYEWRNAHPEIMMNFHKDWPDAQSITIDTNYRSSQEILDVANIVVEPLRRKDGLTKRLKSHRRGVAPSDLFATYETGFEEAQAIAGRIQDAIDRGTSPHEIAVLCRSGMIIQTMERALRDRQITYTVAGSLKFTDREEVKDTIAYLTLVWNPQDYVAFERVSNKPARGIGPQKVAEIRRRMVQSRLGMDEAIESLLSEMNPKLMSSRDLADFLAFYRDARKVVATSASAGQAIEFILERSGYMEWRRANDRDPQRDFRLENLEQIISEGCAYDTIVLFLEAMALQSGSDSEWGNDDVVLSTVHASKGLEFDVVFTPAMEDGVFPNARSQTTSYGADEERRLAHVAWTRARKELHVSWAHTRLGRQTMGEPSPYLAEIGLPVYGKVAPHVSRAPRRLRRRSF